MNFCNFEYLVCSLLGIFEQASLCASMESKKSYLLWPFNLVSVTNLPRDLEILQSIIYAVVIICPLITHYGCNRSLFSSSNRCCFYWIALWLWVTLSRTVPSAHLYFYQSVLWSAFLPHSSLYFFNAALTFRSQAHFRLFRLHLAWPVITLLYGSRAKGSLSSTGMNSSCSVRWSTGFGEFCWDSELNHE